MRGEGYAIIAALLWGFNYPLVKWALGFIPESDFLLLRFSLTTLIFVIYLIIRGENLRVAKVDFLRITALGVVGVGIYNVLWTYGIHRTTSANAAILISASPIFTGLHSLFSGTDKLHKSKWAGTLLAFAGICMIIYWTPGAEIAFHSSLFVGNLLVLCASVIFALYAIMAKPLLQSYSPLKLTTLAMLIGAIFLWVHGWREFDLSFALSLPCSVGFGFAYIVVFGTVAAFLFWYKGVQQTSPFKTIIFHYIVPVVSMIVGALWLDEAMNWERVCGGILVISGLLAVHWDPKSYRRG